MLSRLVIAFLPRNKCLNSIQQSSPEVILECPKIKSLTVSIVSPSVGHEAMELEAMILIFFSFIYISWRLITLQYCRGFCHTLIWITHGFTCVPHPEPLSHLPPHPIPLGHPSAPGLRTYLMHQTWTGDLFHNWYYTCFNAILSYHPTLTFSHRVQYSVLYIGVSFSVLHIRLSLPSF